MSEPSTFTFDSNIQNSSVQEELEGPVRPIAKEIRQKILKERKYREKIKRGLATETISNGFFGYLTLAFQFPLASTLVAFAGAGLVYVPQAAKLGWSKHREKLFSSRLEQYKNTGDSSVFDDVGSTFRGNQPMIDADQPHPYIQWSHILDPVPWYRKGKSLKDQFGIFGSMACSGYYTAKDIGSFILKPANWVIGKVRDKVDILESPYEEFCYVDDPCHKDPSKVMRTRLSRLNNSATVQMPANANGLKKSIGYSQKMIAAEYGIMAANMVGAAGAMLFCYEVSHEITPNISMALQSLDAASDSIKNITNNLPYTAFMFYGEQGISASMEPCNTLIKSMESSAFHVTAAASWALTALIGACPGKDFYDESKDIHKNLTQRWALIAVKYRALEAVKQTGSSISNIFHECTNNLTNWPDELRTDAMAALKFHASKIDVMSLDKKIVRFLDKYDLTPKPEVSVSSEQAEPIIT